jgi:hypothetical protein
MLCLSYYCLCLLFNKIGEEGKQFLPGREGSVGEREGLGAEGRNGPNNECTYELNKIK